MKILSSKLQIDIYIKDIGLAIELNCPVHYFPIYGVDKLQKCQNKDIIKQVEIQNEGKYLIVINISHLNSLKQT